MPGFRLRWRLSTKGVLYVQKHLREAILPLTRVQENVIADFQPGEDVAVTFFVNERDCNEVINALGVMASYIAREHEKLYY